jgi:hypothetical protein
LLFCPGLIRNFLKNSSAAQGWITFVEADRAIYGPALRTPLSRPSCESEF